MISNELVQQLTYNKDLSHNMYMYHHGKILHIFPILPYNYRRTCFSYLNSHQL